MEVDIRVMTNAYCVALVSPPQEYVVFKKDEYIIIRLDSTKYTQENAGVPMGWGGGSST